MKGQAVPRGGSSSFNSMAMPLKISAMNMMRTIRPCDVKARRFFNSGILGSKEVRRLIIFLESLHSLLITALAFVPELKSCNCSRRGKKLRESKKKKERILLVSLQNVGLRGKAIKIGYDFISLAIETVSILL